MRRLSAFAGNLALLGAVHRGESAILFSHHSPPRSTAPRSRRLTPGKFPLPPVAARPARWPSHVPGQGCNGCATAREVSRRNSQRGRNLNVETPRFPLSRPIRKSRVPSDGANPTVCDGAFPSGIPSVTRVEECP
jgi:hypothetical protein